MERDPVFAEKVRRRQQQAEATKPTTMQANSMVRKSRMQKATPDKARKIDAYKDIIKRVEQVCKRLGFVCKELDGSNEDTLLLRIIRTYNRNAVETLNQFTGEPSLILHWADENGIKIAHQYLWNDLPAIRVEFVVKDPTLDIDLVNELWNAIDRGGLKSYWREEDTMEIISLYRDAIRRAAEPLGWEIDHGYWAEFPGIKSNREQWTLWATPPRRSEWRRGELNIYVYDSSTPNFHGFVSTPTDSPAKQLDWKKFDAAVRTAVEKTQRELAEKPFWARRMQTVDQRGQLSQSIGETKNFRGGRPRNADDEWAYDQIRVQGRKPDQVYPEWRKRIGQRATALADTRDSFNKAIRPRRKEEKKGKK